MTPRTACLVLALAALPARADISPRHLAIPPERLDAFVRTLHEFGGTLTAEEASRHDIWLTSSYAVPMPLDFDAQADWDAAIPTDGGLRDPMSQEMFVIEAREEDFEDAAYKWMSRRVKGSDAAAKKRGSKLSPKLGWSSGPVIGVRRGPLTAELRDDGWRLRVSQSIAGRDGWVARAWIGDEDGNFACAFTIGRSLLRASRR